MHNVLSTIQRLIDAKQIDYKEELYIKGLFWSRQEKRKIKFDDYIKYIGIFEKKHPEIREHSAWRKFWETYNFILFLEETNVSDFSNLESEFKKFSLYWDFEKNRLKHDNNYKCFHCCYSIEKITEKSGRKNYYCYFGQEKICGSTKIKKAVCFNKNFEHEKDVSIKTILGENDERIK